MAVFMLAAVAAALVSLDAVSRGERTVDRLFEHNESVAAAFHLADAVDDAHVTALALLTSGTDDRFDELNDDIATEVIPEIEREIDELLDDAGPGEVAQLDAVRAGWHAFVDLWRTGAYEPGASGDEGDLAARTTALFDPMAEAAHGLADLEVAAAAAAHDEAAALQRRARARVVGALLVSLVVGAVCAVALSRSIVRRVRAYSRFAGDVVTGDHHEVLDVTGTDELSELAEILNQLVTRQTDTRRYDETQNEFVTTLQLADDEDEAHGLVKRHLERAITAASVTVLNRNNSADRLEATTELPEEAPLRDTLTDAGPRSCLAIRFGRTNDQVAGGGRLVDCSLCSRLAWATTCEPLLVGGEVIGSVLVERDVPLIDLERRQLRETVSQASPVLANLRNLAVAEYRANNDALTGVANKRAAEDTLKRLAAIAARTLTPLAAVLLDLDHFKQLNDLFGHEKGDEALAAVGAALANALRESDFVGRFGGEEFVVLLPNTSADGAIQVAETLRQAVESIRISGVDRGLSASFGVAVIPDHAGDATTLLRRADRALYAAKAAGRNRVELALDHDEVGTRAQG